MEKDRAIQALISTKIEKYIIGVSAVLLVMSELMSLLESVFEDACGLGVGCGDGVG